MGRTKLKTFNRHWKKYKLITIDHKRIFSIFQGNYKMLIRMRRNIGIRKVGTCGTHMGTLTLSIIMLSQSNVGFVKK